jgi:hypothetical protein
MDRKKLPHRVRHGGSTGTLAMAAAAAAAAAAAVAAPSFTRAAPSNTFNYVHPGGGAWDSTGLPYAAWAQAGTLTPFNLPAVGGTAVISQSGTVGVSGATVTLNVNYLAGPSALASVYLDSGNTLSQLAANTSMWAKIQTVGGTGAASYNQANGANSATDLTLGNTATGNGSYAFGAGSLSLLGEEYVGRSGIGTFTQTGGTHTLAGPYGTSDLHVGFAAGSAGSFILGGGTLVATNSGEFIGNGGNGTYQQTGGSNAALNMALGFSAGGAGTASLSGGTLATTGGTQAGYFGSGVFNHSGGTHNVHALSLGTQPGGVGTYNMSNGANLIVDIESVGEFGQGTFNQNGGSHFVSFKLFTAEHAGSAGTFNLNGGTLYAAATQNNGHFVQNGGVATLGDVGGPTGTIDVGLSGTAAATLNLRSFDQSALHIYGTGAVKLAPGSGPISKVGTFSVSGTGRIDLAHSSMLVDNVLTPESSIRGYLAKGYHANPQTGIGDWNGLGGITSADAIASHNGPNPNFKISIGYVNGAYANDPLVGGPIPGQATLATNRILVRPALYGDLNLDGFVDDTDLAIYSGLGQYNKASPKFGWLGGDLNYDGKVDDTDLQIFSGAGNYHGPHYATAGSPGATPSLTGHAGSTGDDQLKFAYDPATGHLTIKYDGDPNITAANPLQVIRLGSAGGKFIAADFNESAFGAAVTKDGATLNGTVLGAGSIPDNYDLGAVLPAGLTAAQLAADLRLQWNVFAGGLVLKQAEVTAAPEPSMTAVMAAGVSGLLARRRRRCRACRSTGARLTRANLSRERSP